MQARRARVIEDSEQKAPAGAGSSRAYWGFVVRERKEHYDGIVKALVTHTHGNDSAGRADVISDRRPEDEASWYTYEELSTWIETTQQRYPDLTCQEARQVLILSIQKIFRLVADGIHQSVRSRPSSDVLATIRQDAYAEVIRARGDRP